MNYLFVAPGGRQLNGLYIYARQLADKIQEIGETADVLPTKETGLMQVFRLLLDTNSRVVIYGFWAPKLLMGMWLLHLAGKKMILFTHGGFSQVVLEKSKSRLKKLIIWLMRPVLQKAQWFISNQNEIGEYVREKIEPQYVVKLPMAAQPPPFIRREFINRRRLICISRASYEKGVDLLLQALTRLRERSVDCFVEIYVGSNDDVSDLQSMVEQYELPVTINRKTLGDAKWEKIVNASFLIQTSRSESFGQAIAEALSTGTPVIVSNATPWEEVEEEGCGFVTTLDPEDIADKIAAAAQVDDVKYERMSIDARDYLERHNSWPIVTDRFLTAAEAFFSE